MFSLVSFAWLLLEFLLGLQTTHIDQFLRYDWLFIFPAIAMMVWALRYRRVEMKGAWTYWEGIKLGAIMGAMVGILSIPSLYIFVTYVNPDFFKDFIEFSVGSGEATPEEAADYFNFRSYATQSAVFPMIAGIITNGVAGYFSRKPVA